MQVFGSSGFTAAGSSVNGTSSRNTYTATGGQTTFAATYDSGFVDVFMNGIKLVAGTDFTASSGTSIVLASGAIAGDILDIVAYGTFTLATHYTKTESDARYLLESNNLSDLDSAATAITNLGITATAAELNIMDGVTATAAELNILDGVTATAAELNKLDGISATTTELNILGGVTATTSELNILDGVTATTAELNTLDGVTATTAELNILDGVTSTTAELNILDGVTATTAELNHTDGVTSNIQTQLNAKGVTFTTNVITANATGSKDNHYYINGSGITLTLPASPTVGDEVRVSVVSADTDNIIGRNSSNIMGAAEDLTLDKAYSVIYLRYVDATIGWAFS